MLKNWIKWGLIVAFSLEMKKRNEPLSDYANLLIAESPNGHSGEFFEKDPEFAKAPLESRSALYEKKRLEEFILIKGSLKIAP